MPDPNELFCYVAIAYDTASRNISGKLRRMPTSRSTIETYILMELLVIFKFNGLLRLYSLNGNCIEIVYVKRDLNSL